MQQKHPIRHNSGSEWDSSQLNLMLAAARAQASRLAKRQGMSRPDREDLVQDILLALIEAMQRFDPERGHLAGYVAVVARRTSVDWTRRRNHPQPISLDGEEGRALRESLAIPDCDIDLAVSFTRVTQAMPQRSSALLQRIVVRGDVVAARDERSASIATFYRDLHELRCWLRMLGAHPGPAPRRSRPNPSPQAA